MLETVLFYLFSAGLLGSAAAVIFQRRGVYATLFLSLSFFHAALLLFLMGATYLAVLLLIIYMGAVAVLILFTLMLVDQATERLYLKGDRRQKWGGALLSALAAGELIFSLFASPKAAGNAAPAVIDVATLGHLFYTKYVLIFELSGFILLMAVVATLYIGRVDSHPKAEAAPPVYDRHPDVNWVDLKYWQNKE